MVMSLCQMFPSLDPLYLRQVDAMEVIVLIRKITRSSSGSSQAKRKKVYADQVAWF
jgi:hypothetical protein